MMLLLVLVPMALDRLLRLNLLRDILVSVGRMLLQLALMALFLELLIKWDAPWLNVLWFGVMVLAASHSALTRNQLPLHRFWKPVFLAMAISVLLAVVYFNVLIINIKSPFSARFFVVAAGMVLGNAMKGIIIVLDKFITGLARDRNVYYYRLSLGATRYEALYPWIRQSIRASLQPIIATMATMGLVSIPGMMTGQVLAGTNPFLAVRYQAAIVLVIFVAMISAVTLTVLFSIRLVTTDTGTLRPLT